MEKENQIHETYRKERLQLEDQEDQLRQMQKNMQQLAETTYSNIRFSVRSFECSKDSLYFAQKELTIKQKVTGKETISDHSRGKNLGRLPERDTKNLSKSFRDCDDSRQSHEMQKGETSRRGGSKHGKKKRYPLQRLDWKKQ
ncbi:TPA: hypothetical protein ACGVDH_000165 [Enterococcus faecium]|uniref:hypothetical protein n=1 Tax=Enterococcus TaxID=1350 RepID=UPI001CE2FDB0|nr:MULTISPECIES: hypothetical protein [Enterococcus]MDQ8577114.1 hypothetical protein [Enterococcus faecium]